MNNQILLMFALLCLVGLPRISSAQTNFVESFSGAAGSDYPTRGILKYDCHGETIDGIPLNVVGGLDLERDAFEPARWVFVDRKMTYVDFGTEGSFNLKIGTMEFAGEDNQGNGFKVRDRREQSADSNELTISVGQSESPRGEYVALTTTVHCDFSRHDLRD